MDPITDRVVVLEIQSEDASGPWTDRGTRRGYRTTNKSYDY